MPRDFMFRADSPRALEALVESHPVLRRCQWILTSFSDARWENPDVGFAWVRDRVALVREASKNYPGGFQTWPEDVRAQYEAMNVNRPAEYEVMLFTLSEVSQTARHQKQIELSEELGLVVHNVWTKDPRVSPIDVHKRRMGSLTLNGILRRIAIAGKVW